MNDVRWLSREEDRAWRAWRRMHTYVPARIAQDLWSDSRLSEADYEVLSTLSESPGQRRRLGELAAKMLWSRSRLSHHVSRMEARGLVRRDDSPDDRRGSVVVLTPTGRDVLEDAAPSHVASVRRHLVDRLTAEELDLLGRIADRVVGPTAANGQPVDSGPTEET